jgi:predicted helicase
MVILGNPPYSYESMNTDPWIVNLVKDYYHVDGKPLGERNPKGLLDDYVKFIRFAQHRVAETGYGVVALITNHGYLDNPTFRGMRQNLMQTFDEVYVLDLHGNSKKKEVCRDGSPDQNVFDIQQGVAIAFFIKYQDSQQDLAKVYHADLWGVREVKENKELVGGKYHWLDENDISSTEWKVINPKDEYYLFKPFNAVDFPEYAEGTWKIDKIFPSNSNGIETGRDEHLITLTREEIQRVMTDLVDSDLSDKDIYEKYGIQDTTGWHFVKRRKLLLQEGLKQELICKIYRKPFDFGFTYYHEFLRRQQFEVLGNLLKPNVALLSMRQVALESSSYNHFGVTDIIADNRSFLSNKGKANLFPLYIYPTNTILLEDEFNTRRPNL